MQLKSNKYITLSKFTIVLFYLHIYMPFHTFKTNKYTTVSTTNILHYPHFQSAKGVDNFKKYDKTLLRQTLKIFVKEFQSSETYQKLIQGDILDFHILRKNSHRKNFLFKSQHRQNFLLKSSHRQNFLLKNSHRQNFLLKSSNKQNFLLKNSHIQSFLIKSSYRQNFQLKSSH